MRRQWYLTTNTTNNTRNNSSISHSPYSTNNTHYRLTSKDTDLHRMINCLGQMADPG